MYYDPNKTLSRQRLFNFVVGARGCGKTYGAKKTVINKFLKTGKQFVYLRRYETELPAAEMRNFFDDVSVEFPGVEFKSYNGLFRINGEIAGWYFPLSKATMLKSIPFPNVWIIIFDEFIIEVGVYRYLPNEVRTFLECYSTVSRDRDIIALFLSNAISMTNPYFLYFNLSLNKNQTIKLTELISLELVQSVEYKNHVMNTKFGQLIANTDYGNYNMQNKFLLDTDSFIGDLPVGSLYICTIIVDGREFGYYTAPEETQWYISDRIDRTSKRKYALNFKDHEDHTQLVAKSNPYIRQMLDVYCQGNLRFTSVEVKNIISTTLRRLI